MISDFKRNLTTALILNMDGRRIFAIVIENNFLGMEDCCSFFCN